MTAKTRQILIGASITLFWLIMVTTLLKNRVFIPTKPESGELITPRQLVEKWQDYDEWMQVLMNDQPVGVFNAALKKDENAQRFNASFRMIITMSIGATKQPLRWEGLASLDRNFLLEKFFVNADLGFSKFTIVGLIDGKNILYKIARESEATYGALRLETSASFLDAASELLLRKIDLKSGETYTLRAFDPVWRFGAGTVEIAIGEKETIQLAGKPVEAYRVETQLMNIKTTSWVTDSGQTVKRQLLEGVTMELIPKSKAVAFYPELAEELAFPMIRLGELRRNARNAARTSGIMDFLQDLTKSQ